MPASSAILMENPSTLQTSTASNDNLLYALPHCAPDSSTQCPPSHPSTPPTSRHVKNRSNYHCAIMICQCQSLSCLGPSAPHSRPNPTSTQTYFGASLMGSSRPSLTEKLAPASLTSDMRIASIASNNKCSITRLRSMNLHLGTCSTMARSAISTSQCAMGCTKRPSGSDSTTMAQYLAILAPRALTSSPTLSTYMWCQTTVSTLPSMRSQPGLGTCSPAPVGTFRFYNKQWPTPTTGGWHVKSHAIESSMMMSQWSLSRSSNISATLTPCEHALPLVSPDSCSPARLNELLLCKMCRGSSEQYTQGGRGAVAQHMASISVPCCWKMSRDVRGHPS
jgi:hypothetical protein